MMMTEVKKLCGWKWLNRFLICGLYSPSGRPELWKVVVNLKQHGSWKQNVLSIIWRVPFLTSDRPKGSASEGRIHEMIFSMRNHVDDPLQPNKNSEWHYPPKMRKRKPNGAKQPIFSHKALFSVYTKDNTENKRRGNKKEEKRTVLICGHPPVPRITGHTEALLLK